jgi:hypothetical protein
VDVVCPRCTRFGRTLIVELGRLQSIQGYFKATDREQDTNNDDVPI